MPRSFCAALASACVVLSLLLLTAAPVGAVPSVQAIPSLSGVVAVGSTVTCVPGVWSGSGPLTKSYRWVIDGRGPDPYVGTGLTYEPVPADEGWPLQCEETVSDADDTSAQNSNATLVLGPQPLTNAVKPQVTGKFIEGETVTCAPGTWSRTSSYAYAWLRAGEVIAGATESTRALTDADAFRDLSCRVTATAAVGGQTATATSDVVRVAPRPREIVQPGKPTVTGEARVGGQLRCQPAAGSEEYQHEWKYASGQSLDPRVFALDLVVPIPLGGQSLVCVASISNIDGYREARSEPVFITPLRRPSGIPDFPVFEQGPLDRYLAANVSAKVTASALSWRSSPKRFLQAGDVRVNGIELTQGTQYRFTAFAGAGLPNRCVNDPVPWVASICPPGQPVKYAGVNLVAGRSLTARVFLDRAGPRRTTPVRARLTVRTSAGAVIGSMVQTVPLNEAVSASAPRLVTDSERRDPAQSVNFDVPASYARFGGATFEAEVVPDEEGCPTGDCTVNNRFVLVGVPFYDTGVLRVGTVRVGFSPLPPLANRASSSDADFRTTALTQARKLLPVRDIQVPSSSETVVADTTVCSLILADPWLGALARADATFPQSCRGMQAFDAVERIASARPGWIGGIRWYDTLVGLLQTDGYARGWGSTNPNLSTVPVFSVRGPVSVLEPKRQRLTVAHELGHNTGLPHAGPACTAGAEPWAPDNRGRLQGVGWDGSRVMDDSGSEFYDFMSYCASEANAWVSPRNWDRMVDTFDRLNDRAAATGTRLGRRPQAATLPAGDHVSVTAFTLGERAKIVTVRTGPAAVLAGEPSGMVVRAVDAAGAVLAQAEALLLPATEDDAGSLRLIKAQLPGTLAGVARLEVVLAGGGAAAGEEVRPPGVPSVQLRPVQVGRRGPVTVRWRAAQAKTADVLVSVDGGKRWKVAWTGPAAAGRAVLEGGQVPRAPRARVRVVVTDGWSQAARDSSGFGSPGSPPELAVGRPGARVTIRQGERLSLEATAFDDARRSLTGGALVWEVRGRRLATGAAAVAPELPPGRHLITVTARDRFGRETSKRISVRVRAAAPMFTALTAPPTVPAGSRTVKLQVAASRPAQLRVLGQRFAVGPRSRSIAVRLPAGGSGELVLDLELSADGRRSRVEAVIVRG